jgi:hypothetical protein
MRNRLLLSLFAATSVIALLVLAGRLPGLPESAQAGGWGVGKNADAPSVDAGSQIGFTVTVVNHQSSSYNMYIRDPLPGKAGTNWMIESALVSTSPQGNGAVPTQDCMILGSPPVQTLRCVHEGYEDFYLKVHVISATTAQGCGEYTNTAEGSVGGIVDQPSNTVTTIVNCPTPTPSPSPSPSPEPFLPRLFGGHDSQGDNVVIILPTSVRDTVNFAGYDFPLGPACPGQMENFWEPAIPLGSDGTFDKQDGTHEVQGTLTDENGISVAQGNITVGAGTDCANTLAFVAEQSNRALLVGDTLCGWPELYASAAAAGIAFPQGPTPAPTPPANPKKGVTVKDVIAVIKWVAGFEEDSPPLDCPLIAAAFPTPVPGSATPTPAATATPLPPLIWGDVDCSSHVDEKDALELLQFAAGLNPPSCGGRKVGHFILLDR